jgi:hypothetical protein
MLLSFQVLEFGHILKGTFAFRNHDFVLYPGDEASMAGYVANYYVWFVSFPGLYTLLYFNNQLHSLYYYFPHTC